MLNKSAKLNERFPLPSPAKSRLQAHLRPGSQTPQPSTSFRRSHGDRSDSEAFAALLAHLPDPETTESFDDFEALIAAYEGHCLSRTAAGDVTTDAQRALWEHEAHTWKLVKMLTRIRLDSDSDSAMVDQSSVNALPQAFQSDHTLVQSLLASDKTLAEIYTIRLWLEEIAPPSHPAPKRTGYLSQTAKKIKDTQRNIKSGVGLEKGDYVSQLDPDAPTRQGKFLAPEDVNFERELTRSIFESIRRGNIQAANDLARQCDEPWRAASLRGGTFFLDAPLDDAESNITETVGNSNRGLWKAVCFQISSEESTGSFERAVYAYMAGDVQNILPVCQSWEDHVWAYYHCLLDAEIDQGLSRIRRGFFDAQAQEIVRLPMPQEPLAPSSIFEHLFKHDNELLKKSSRHPFHIIQASLALDRLEDIFARLRQQVDEYFAGSGEPEELETLPHILRFGVHLALFLRQIGFILPETDVNYVIQGFTKILIKESKKDIIAVYAKHLPPNMQTEVYASFLQSIHDEHHVQMEYLKLGHSHGLPVLNIARATVELIFSEAIRRHPAPQDVSLVTLFNPKDPVTRDDLVQVRALEWLSFSPAQKTDALYKCNEVMRRFFVLGKVNAAQLVVNTFPNLFNDAWLHGLLGQAGQDFVDESQSGLELAVREQLDYRQLLVCVDGYSRWRVLSSRNPKLLRKGENVRAQEYQTWCFDMKELTDSVTKNFDAILTSEFLPRSEIDEDSDMGLAVAAQIRAIYIPQVILWFHQMLFETKEFIPGNVEKSLELVRLLTDTHTSFYHEFAQSKRLEEFMKCLRASALSSLSGGSDKKRVSIPWGSSQV